jgi:hypothetical protein
MPSENIDSILDIRQTPEEKPVMRRFLKDVHSDDHEQSFFVVAQEWIHNFSIGDLPEPFETHKTSILACCLLLILVFVWRVCRSKGNKDMMNINKEFQRLNELQDSLGGLITTRQKRIMRIN